jgi:hypothetical protein
MKKPTDLKLTRLKPTWCLPRCWRSIDSLDTNMEATLLVETGQGHLSGVISLSNFLLVVHDDLLVCGLTDDLGNVIAASRFGQIGGESPLANTPILNGAVLSGIAIAGFFPAAPIILTGHRAKVPVFGRSHVDANVMRANIPIRSSALTVSEVSSLRHSIPRTWLQSTPIHVQTVCASTR